MEVKIGVQHAHRELVLESEQSPADIRKAVQEAIDNNSVLVLADEKGRQVIVPSAKLAYVDIEPATARKVGFTAS